MEGLQGQTDEIQRPETPNENNTAEKQYKCCSPISEEEKPNSTSQVGTHPIFRREEKKTAPAKVLRLNFILSEEAQISSTNDDVQSTLSNNIADEATVNQVVTDADIVDEEEEEDNEKYTSDSTLATSTFIKDFSKVSLPNESETKDSESEAYWEISSHNVTDKLDRKCHNLSIAELRKKLSFCPICRIQYSSHKLANMCLSRHGKRQCWLCLEVLSAKKDDFCKHSIEYHAVSTSGDIVGCPYCGKCFDFRQGLNQHIVKIHFSESISDMDAVASLSPTTLVDIFTGKPRSYSSSAEDFQSKQELTNEEVAYSFEQSTFENSPATSSNAKDNSLPPNADNSQRPLYQSEKQVDVIMHPGINIGSNETQSSDLNKHTIPNDTLARPSVITLSSGMSSSVRKMYVPPEQPLSSLDFKSQSEISDSLSFDIISSQHHVQQQKSSLSTLPNQNVYCPEENNVEVVENAGFKFHKDSSSLGYGFSHNPNPFTGQMSKVISDPEKYEPALYSEFTQTKKHLGGNDPSAISDLSTSPYEQVIITRINSPHMERKQHQQKFLQDDVHHLQPLQQSFQYSTYTGASCSTVTPPTTSNTHNTGNSSGNDNLESVYSDVLKSTSAIYPMNLRDSDPIPTSDYGNADSTLSPSAQSVSSFSPCSTTLNVPENAGNCLKNGNCLNQEIEGSYVRNNSVSSKYADNCGVKRRILMKAMWEEHNQIKKPALFYEPFLHDLNNGEGETSIMNSNIEHPHSVSSTFSHSPTLHSPSVEMQNTTAFHGSDNRENSLLRERTEIEQKGQHFTPNQPPIYASQGEMIKHAGTFFEQYLKQDRNSTGDPYKLLELIRPVKPPVLSSNACHQKDLEIALSWNANNFSCARNTQTRTWNVGGGEVRTVDECMPPPPPPPPQRLPHQWQAPTPAPTTSIFPRSQFSTTHPLYARKAPNPAFWDNLRARLLAQSSVRCLPKTGNNETFTRASCLPKETISTYGGNFANLSKVEVENVVVKNPFEEEATNILSKPTANDLNSPSPKVRDFGTTGNLKDKTSLQTQQQPGERQFQGFTRNSSSIASYSTLLLPQTSSSENCRFRHPNLMMAGHPQISSNMPPPPPPTIQLPTPAAVMAKARQHYHNRNFVNEQRLALYDPMRYFNSPFYNKYTEGYTQLLHKLHKLNKSKTASNDKH